MYQFRESVQQAFEPFRAAADAVAEYYRDHPDGVDPVLRRTALASCEMFDRLTRHWEKPAFGITQTIVDGEPVRVHQEIVSSKPFGDLVHFRKHTPSPTPRVLIVPPMAGHYSTLLRGTVTALLPEHDVYVCDWANARDVPLESGHFDLDDYIDYVLDFLRELGPGINLIGVCQAAVPTLAVTALLNADESAVAPQSLVLMAGPVDARQGPTEVNRFATSHPFDWFERVMIDTVPRNFPGAGRQVYPGYIQLGAFMGMNADRHVAASLRFFGDLVAGDEAAAETHRLFYDEYLAVMDLTAEFYLQTVRSVFQEFHLPRGIMVSRDRPVQPAAITRTALMTVEGERDDICGIGQTEAAQTLCVNLPPEMRHHLLQPGVGHFGVFSGRRWRNEVMPQVRSFIRAHDRRD